MRKLKTSGSEKSIWSPEVDILLSLKNKLASLTGKPTEPASSGKKKKK